MKRKKKEWLLSDGNARASIYPEGPNGEIWNPKDNDIEYDDNDTDIGPTVQQVMRIKGVEECASCGAQSYHVIVETSDYHTLAKAVDHVKKVMAGYFERSISRKERKAALTAKGAGK